LYEKRHAASASCTSDPTTHAGALGRATKGTTRQTHCVGMRS
jgi:hypothetical protein